MKKYKVEYEKMYDDKSLDSIASLEHIIVEAKIKTMPKKQQKKKSTDCQNKILIV